MKKPRLTKSKSLDERQVENNKNRENKTRWHLPSPFSLEPLTHFVHLILTAAPRCRDHSRFHWMVSVACLKVRGGVKGLTWEWRLRLYGHRACSDSRAHRGPGLGCACMRRGVPVRCLRCGGGELDLYQGRLRPENAFLSDEKSLSVGCFPFHPGC